MKRATTFLIRKRFEFFRKRAPRFERSEMVTVAQLVRASGCGPECRGFDSPQSPQNRNIESPKSILCLDCYIWTSEDNLHV